MTDNGQETDEERKERAVYQRGQSVADEARHKVQDPIVGRNEEYTAQDVMCAMLYMHRQTIAQVGTATREYDFSEEAEEKIADLLTDIRSQLGPTPTPSDSNEVEGESQ